MAKQSSDQNLFDIQMETEDIEIPGDFALRVPVAKDAAVAPEVEDAPTTPETITLPQGGTPPLLAVDIAPGEVPNAGSIVNPKPTIQQETPVVPDTPAPETTPKPEEKKEVTPKTEQGQQGTGKDAEEEKLSPTYLHAAALHEAGILPNLDLSTIKDLESGAMVDKLLEANRKEVEDQAATLNEQYKNQFNDEQKRVIEMFDDGIPFDDASNIVYNQLRYDNLTEAQIKESPDIQKQLYREFLYAKGHDESYIEKSVKQSEDLENLETDGLSSHQKLVTMAKEDEVAAKATAKEDAKVRQTRKDESMVKIKDDVSKTTEILKGMPLTDADKAAIIKNMTVPSAEVVRNGQKISISKREEIRMKNPIEFEKRMAYYVNLGLFDENPALDVIEKQGETKSVQKLKTVLAGGAAPKPGSPVITKKDTNKILGKDEDTVIILPGQISTVRHSD